jgi:hypothetical protein
VVGKERDSDGFVSDARMAICMSSVEVGESGGVCERDGEVECLLCLSGGRVFGSMWLAAVVRTDCKGVDEVVCLLLVEVVVEDCGS